MLPLWLSAAAIDRFHPSSLDPHVKGARFVQLTLEDIMCF